MSNENVKIGGKRAYRLKVRASRQDDVHRRITLAAVHLHETVGPAGTTMQAIAELAGVRRATVYNHFPAEVDLVDACSSHWFSENPPPDPGEWERLEEVEQRTVRALARMYEYFERGQSMLGKVLRDASVVPAVEEIRRRKWLPLIEGIVDALAAGPTLGKVGGRKGVWKRRIQASLRVALDFSTWQTLVNTGLSTSEAASLVASWVNASRNMPLDSVTERRVRPR